MSRPFRKDKSGLNIGSMLVCVLLVLASHTAAQTGRQGRVTTGVDDVVFAISFSPDGSTLAIARGASDPAQRYARIELWDMKAGTLRHVIKGFDGPIKSISFSPDGQTLLSVSREYRVLKIQEKAGRRSQGFVELKWWDAQTGEFKHNFILPREDVFSAQATYSPDGKQLALVASYFSFFSFTSVFDPLGERTRPTVGWPSRPMTPSFEAELNLLDAQSGEAIVKLNSGRPGRAVFSPDGLVLAKENGKEIKVWNLQTGREERRLKNFKGEPNTIAFSSDGQSLAVAVTKYYHEPEGNLISVIGSSEIQIFEVGTWEKVLQLQNVGMVNSLAFMPNGKLLVIGGLIHEQAGAGALPGVKLWDLHNKTTAIYHTGGEDFARAVDLLTISRNGGLLAFKSGPDIVQVLDSQTWKVKYTFDANSDADSKRPTSRFVLSLNRVIAVAFSQDGKTLTGEVEGSGIKLWDSRTGEVKNRLVSPEGSASIAAISSNGESIAEAGDDATLRLWNAASESKAVVPRPGSEPISALALSSDSRLLAIGSGKQLVLASAETGETVKTFPDQATTIEHLAFSNNNQILASADGSGIKVRDLTSGQIRNAFTPGGRVTALRFAPGDRILASASEDGSVSLWDLQTGVLSSQLKKHSGAVNAITFSLDGTLMATGADDRTVIIWAVATGKARRTLKGHDLAVTSLAFSPDASLLACGSGNASVVLWDVRTGELSRVLR